MKTVTKVLYKQSLANLGKLFWVFVLTIAVVGFDVLMPWPFKILIDNVLSAEPIDPSSPFAFLHVLFPSRDLLGFFAVFTYFASTFLMSIAEYAKAISMKTMTKSATVDFSKSAFKNLQTLAIGFYSKQKIGDYIYRLGYDVEALGDLLEYGVLPLLTSGLYVVVTLCIMALIDVRLTLLSMAVLPFLAFGLHSFNSRLTSATKRSEAFNSVTFAFMEETLSHLKVIQAFSQESKKSKAFDRRIETSLGSGVIVYRLDLLLSLLVGVVIAISYSVIMLYGIRAVFHGALTTGLLVVFIFYLDNLTTPILSLIYAATAARQDWQKIIRMDEFFHPKSHLDYHAGPVKKLTGTGIRFEHVSVEIASGKRIINDLSFEIEAGKRTVIFGASGSGKTSVANLIMRFIDKPSHGRVLIGGTPIEQYDLLALREKIAYVPQEISLFNDTVRNNIVFGNKNHSWSQVRHAAQLAAADEFIRKMDGKYNFRVGESGGFLSGGQRQRLMLARALMKENAEILIFDETFSALDIRTREKVLHNIYEYSAGKTMILISNVFDVIKSAENIVVLSHGKLLYSGPASRLPKEISLYKMIQESEPDLQVEA